MKCYQSKKKFVFCTVIIFTFLISFYSHVTASIDYYPTKGWKTTAPEDQGMQSQLLVDMLEDIKDHGYNIQSISITRNGYLVMDSYVHPFAENQKHEMRSVTKSVISALVGIAIDKGYIKDVNQTLADLFPNRKISNMDNLKQSITLKHLLMMGSGLDCNDGWENNWAGLMTMRRTNDWVQYILNLPMEKAPGEWFHYCNGVSHLLSAVISEKTGMKTIDFAKKYLFGPLGIEDIKWETSPQGINIGYDKLWLQPKDMAKIGLLYLNKGKWEDKQIISSKWIEESIQPYQDSRLLEMKYGYQWWVNLAGFYSANGAYGQFIYIVPDKNLVAVFTGYIEGIKQFISISLLKDYIIPAVVSDKSMPIDQAVNAKLNQMIKTLAEAPAAGVVWKSENDGVAKNGIFTRVAVPSFTFTYPLGSKKAELQFPAQVMRMKTSEGVNFYAAVSKIPDGIQLADFGPKYFAIGLQNDVGANVEIISNKEITLKCGTKAYRCDMKWIWNDTTPITTLLVSAYKDGHCIYMAAHPWENPEKVAPIVQSLYCK
jgi:CubicO group peptidase (beta-lactamase class C family)